jgi:hypothetical protein
VDEDLMQRAASPPQMVTADLKAGQHQTTRLDLAAIETSLRALQVRFDKINASLDSPRDPFSDEVLGNLLSGYGYLNTLIDSNIDLLAPGASQHLLKLNCLVLWGACDLVAGPCASEFTATEEHFYDDASAGGVRALMDYVAGHRGAGIWKRAAGTYIHILSQPQLFLEGNHRTGALVMSYILCKRGKAPFVLTPENAKAYFDPSTLVKGCRKHSFRSLFEIPKLKKRLAKVLQETAEPDHLDPAGHPETPWESGQAVTGLDSDR